MSNFHQRGYEMHTRQVLAVVFIFSVIAIVCAPAGLSRLTFMGIALASGSLYALEAIADARYRLHKRVVMEFMHERAGAEFFLEELVELTGLPLTAATLRRMVAEGLLTVRQAQISDERLAIRGERPAYVYRLSSPYLTRQRYKA